MRGTLRRRLLVNAVVDPDEAARHLPPGIRPHLTAAGTVVGCCLLDIEHLRPARSARGSGHRAACRRAPDLGGVGERRRRAGRRRLRPRTSNRLTTCGSPRRAMVPRCSPAGRHRRPRHRRGLRLVGSGRRLLDRRDGDGSRTTRPPISPVIRSPALASVPTWDCRRTTTACSKARAWSPLGAPFARSTSIALESTFIAGFATAEPAPAYLMEDVAVAWSARSRATSRETGAGVKLVIAGGTGSLGRRVADHFSAAGADVVILTRTPRSAIPHRQVVWDGRTRGAWADELDGSVLLNLAGELVDRRPTASNIELLKRSRVEPTTALVDASAGRLDADALAADEHAGHLRRRGRGRDRRAPRTGVRAAADGRCRDCVGSGRRTRRRPTASRSFAPASSSTATRRHSIA